MGLDLPLDQQLHHSQELHRNTPRLFEQGDPGEKRRDPQ